jgi:hypothetical protein
VNTWNKFLALAALGLAALPAAAMAQRGPTILILGTDTDQGAVPRGAAIFGKVQDAIAETLKGRGFHVFDETAIPRDVLPAGGLPRDPAELIETAKLAKVPIDVVVVTQISASIRSMPFMRDHYKPIIHVVDRMTAVRSGELLGRYDFGEDIDFPLLPGDCAMSRECLLESVGRDARVIGQAVGSALASKLATFARP